MDSGTSKTYLKNILLYLEKDWEWSPILLKLLDEGGFEDHHMDDIIQYIDNAIKRIKNTEGRKKLESIQMTLKKILTSEKSSKKIDLEEAKLSLLKSYP